MPTEVSRKIQNVMAKEMGHMGTFILKKQCADHNLDADEITPGDLPTVANAISKAIIVFTGEEKARRIDREIRSIQ